jgi:hypothetical protein
MSGAYRADTPESHFTTASTLPGEHTREEQTDRKRRKKKMVNN